MIALLPYAPPFEDGTLRRISEFFGFHQSLLSKEGAPPAFDAAASDEARETLAGWLTPPSRLYVITKGEQAVGFVRIHFRGPSVAWIEDVFVDAGHRGQGIATQAIAMVEDMLRGEPECQAICFDVVPRNADALRLYHKLGYRDLSIVTLRKELGQSKRDIPVELFGMEFHY